MMKNKVTHFIKYMEGIELQDVATWPLALKAVIFLLGGGLFLLLGYGLVIRPKMNELEQVKQQEAVLRLSFEKKYAHYIQVQAKKKSIEKQELAMSNLLVKIPEKIDVSQLLDDISALGTASLVMLRSMRLQPENKMAFYIELPIEISVRGSYHQLAGFVSALMALPYLITFQNVMLSATEPQVDQSLMLNMTMKTYQRGS